MISFFIDLVFVIYSAWYLDNHYHNDLFTIGVVLFMCGVSRINYSLSLISNKFPEKKKNE